ncbi:MAG: Apolipoprotein N-acyltransferase [Bacteroidia bacterium]|nr:Apolipoprotein N-acyltransferase [Bacteroidia bacterium]
MLLSVAWPAGGFAPLLFVALVPLLWVENRVASKGYKYSGIKLLPYSYITFLVWNVLTTYWVYHSSAFGGIIAFTLNSLFQALVFQLFHFTKKHTGEKLGYASLVVYFIAWEYFHLQWDLSWPWLTFGNGFSEYYKWIQWYEYTGVFGGNVWMFVSNIVVFHIIKVKSYEVKSQKLQRTAFDFRLFSLKPLIFLSLWISIPIIISLIIYHTYTEKANPVNIVVVQPNIDPYNEKFDGMTASDQLEKMLSLAKEKIDSTTDYLIGPETALVEGIWENKIETSNSIQRLRQFLADYPNLKFVLGLSSYRMYEEGEKPSPTARPWRRKKNMSWDAYNTGMQMQDKQPIQLYHKSKLVPGVEKMPFPSLLKPLEKYAIDLGGMPGSLGVQDERSVFISYSDNKKIAPAICYESIYGEYCGEYINKGAGLIFIITNDGWWKDTPGYRQHCSYARMRAIEHRRSIARSANTGTSCFINQRGDMEQATDFWVPAVIKGTLNYNEELTFYTKHGDYIVWISALLSAVLLVYAFIKRFTPGRIKK